MEDALLGLGAGGGVSALTLIYTVWQTKKNTEEIENLEEKIGTQNILIDVLNSNLSNFKLHAAETYANKDDIKELARDIKNYLQRIEDKLDQKVDKP